MRPAASAPIANASGTSLWVCIPEPIKKFAALYAKSAEGIIRDHLPRRPGVVLTNDVIQFRRNGLEVIFKVTRPDHPPRALHLGIALGSGKLRLLVILKEDGKEPVTQQDNVMTMDDRQFVIEAQRWATQLTPFLWTGEL